MSREVTITSEHDFGDVVYLKSDPDKLPRVVTRILVSASGGVLYDLAQGVNGSFHWGFEITKEKTNGAGFKGPGQVGP